MKIKNLKWGYDGGGFGCGPIEGNSIVEVASIDEDGKLVFLTVSSNGEGIDFTISDVPMFDLMIFLNDSDVDFEQTLSVVGKNTLENYGAVWDEDVPEELLSSKYKDLLAVGFDCLSHYMNTSTDDEVEPEEYIKKFIDEDGNMVNIPEINLDYDDEEWED